MPKRKLQLVAGSTYSISLPKAWVTKNNLRVSDEINVQERGDKELVVSSQSSVEKEYREIDLNVDEYSNIMQIIIAVYHLGIETINLVSGTEISKETKTQLRRVINSLNGLEIVYEDENKIVLKMLLDRTRLKVTQLAFRLCLIIDQSLAHMINCMEDPEKCIDLDEIRMNEEEVDKLYHLANTILSLSLTDADILASSKVRNTILVPSFFTITKKFEKIHDEIDRLSRIMAKEKRDDKAVAVILSQVREDLKASIEYIIKEKKKDDFLMKSPVKGARLEGFSDSTVMFVVKDLLRHTRDIRDEITRLAFYRGMIREN